MKKATSCAFVLVLFFVSGCGGGSSNGSNSGNAASSQGISGSYEFVATSATTGGSTTLIEANLSANGAQSSASGPNQVQTATRLNGTWYVNGVCSSPSPGQNGITGTVSGTSITLTFNEGGNTFTGQGTVTGNTISGTYSGTNPNCSDSGTFTGTQVPNLAGTFSGILNFPSGSDQVTATLTEGSNDSLMVQTTLSGTDNGTFTFSGSAVANVMFVSGSVNGNPFALFGYFDSSGTYTGTPNSIQVFDDNLINGAYANYGLLVKQGSGNVSSLKVSPTSAAAAPNGGTATFTALATVQGESQPLDVSAVATWSLSNVNDFIITPGDPVTVTVQPSATPGEQVTVTATYQGTTTLTADAILSVQSPGSIGLVQSANFTSQANSASMYTATFSKSVTTGDLIVVGFWWNYPPGSSIVSVADSVGNSYKQALVTPPGNDDNAWVYFATQVSGGIPLSITVTVSQSTADQFSMAVLEYSGVSTPDETSTNSGSMASNNTVASSGGAVTREANELIIGVCLSNELNGTMAGSGFTSRFASNYFMVEDEIVSSTGTYDADFLLPTGCQFCGWQAGMVTFY